MADAVEEAAARSLLPLAAPFYSRKVRELGASLKRNPVLRAKVTAGFVAPEALVAMGPQELLSQEMGDLAGLTVVVNGG